MFRRIIIAIEGRCEVDIDNMLQQELRPVPLSLAKTDGRLHESDKPIQSGLLQEGVIADTVPVIALLECTSVVQAKGTHKNVHIFGNCYSTRSSRMSIDISLKNAPGLM